MMMAFVAAAAAAQSPVLLASRDEAQWRLFVRASVQSRPAAGSRKGSRLMQLQGAVRQLGDEYEREARRLAGPSGL
jgi:hypothetical protein